VICWRASSPRHKQDAAFQGLSPFSREDESSSQDRPA